MKRKLFFCLALIFFLSSRELFCKPQTIKLFVDGIETPYVIDTMEICMDNNKKTYNRAKKKYEDRKVIKEYEDLWEKEKTVRAKLK